MSFCPNCKYEYNPGIAICPDCDSELVAELPQQPEPEATEDLVCAATYPFEVYAQTAKLRLAAYGIPSAIYNEKMAQSHMMLVWADGGVKLMVLEHDLAAAQNVLSDDSACGEAPDAEWPDQ